MTPEELDALTKDQWRDLLVTPRYLAGTGADLDAALRPLFAAGFVHHIGDDGEVFAHSPCHRIRVAFLPENEEPGLWHVTASRSPVSPLDWKAVFDAEVPVEVVTAVTTAVIAELAAERGQRHLTLPVDTSVWRPLRAAGWQPAPARHNQTRLVSPDGYASFLCNRSEVEYGEEMGPGPYTWHASIGVGRITSDITFTGETPIHLVAACTAALADPAPVIRTRNSIRRYLLPHLDIRLATPEPEPGRSSLGFRPKPSILPGTPNSAQGRRR
ncbi:DUF317 domain-containing protein [Yinghuangia sp. ASG 101]|uniref:DUF317 domain-containing protein n=1 Tax=Yinghuangia sp. ASG 101 TaxID=2896848 RepID=UPI001E5B6F40|nr:DUF317 domain-containing protein [Yinghuangia sp. ASG 101]UGQ10952.1 DUF317 domain-containing protein [Yinghuangia sp. ASG 101]